MISNIGRGIELLSEGPGTFCRGVVRHSHRKFNHLKYSKGIDVMEEDWDNLILLDACRYDAFLKANTLDGVLESRISRGSASREFITKNFTGRKLHDTVYITANPYVGHVEPDDFHAVITLLDEWDDDLQTVKPETVVEKVKDEYGKYDDKRIIIHFMQPHQPYIGPKADMIKSELENKMKIRGWNNTLREPNKDLEGAAEGIKQLRAPKYPELDVTDEDIWEAYYETLELALTYVEDLLEHIDGKTVISSDHGELIGEKPFIFSEKKIYGHPGGTYTSELRKVPWFIIESENRRTMVSEPPTRYETVEEESLDSKLEALGYK